MHITHPTLTTLTRDRLCFGLSTGLEIMAQSRGRDGTAREQLKTPLPLISSESGTG